MKVKVTKTYALSEGTLEKDIDKFIKDAKNGVYQYDYKYGQEGLKLIKAYFRMFEDEFKKQSYQTARACYKKLMFLLLQSEYNYLDYEDIVGKLNFEKFLENYFICLIKSCSVEELFHEFIEYLKVKEDYYFESVNKIIFTNLLEENLKDFLSLVEKEAENIKEKDYTMYDLIYFLLDYARIRKNKEEFDRLCVKYKDFVEKHEPFDENNDEADKNE